MYEKYLANDGDIYLAMRDCNSDAFPVDVWTNSGQDRVTVRQGTNGDPFVTGSYTYKSNPGSQHFLDAKEGVEGEYAEQATTVKLHCGNTAITKAWKERESSSFSMLNSPKNLYMPFNQSCAMPFQKEVALKTFSSPYWKASERFQETKNIDNKNKDDDDVVSPAEQNPNNLARSIMLI
jgi:hypothetical protein